ncbi:MAG: Major Facilitator Superfamily protein [Pelotomaculum sp. PtaB.Bin104]|nr:MAG: Major Facilitator Superfamily protein [Pelotomaculum sp. PtaB.Bin104]
MSAPAPGRGKIFALAAAHLLNDWYMNYIQTLLPYMVAAGLGISKGAFLISAFTVTSSLVQPFMGYLVDNKNQRWMVYAGTLWMAVLISLVGVLQNYPLLVLTVKRCDGGRADAGLRHRDRRPGSGPGGAIGGVCRH